MKWFIKVEYPKYPNVEDSPDDYVGPFDTEEEAQKFWEEYGPRAGVVVEADESAQTWTIEEFLNYINKRI